MKEKLSYVKYILFHPFDGFYEAKHRGRGSLPLASIFILIFCVLKCVQYQYTGFIMNFNPLWAMNSLTIFISAFSILGLFTVANWTVTTLFDGKGNLSEIFMVLGYSMIPLILSDIISVVVSNYIIMEEVVLLTAFKGIAIAWFVFLLVIGLCVIHEYQLFQNLVTLVATLISAMILVFLFVLLLSLMEQMIYFIINIVSESVRRF